MAAIDFFPLLRHSKGEWAGTPFILEPWQAFIIGSIFGWVRKDDETRRFRIAYNEVPRKNGKSTLVACTGILTTFFDDEPGAEGYCVATKKDQAKIVWAEAKRMIENTPDMRQLITILTANLHSESTASKLEPLGSDSKTQDGLNIHFAAIDEVHAHKTRDLIDKIETSTASRRQPVQFEITTAGFDRHSICWEHHDYSTKILEGVFTDDTWFAFIAAADEGDDWKEMKTWAKANPNLGVSVKVDDLERKCAKAKETPAAENTFRRLHLNEWTEQSVRWLPMDKWDAAEKPRPVEELRGLRCFAGLDLAATRDITALCLVFFEEWERVDVLCRFWIPEERLQQRARSDRVPYQQWIDEGYIRPTPGNVTDYEFVRSEVVGLSKRYEIIELAYDPWNATHLATQLELDGAPMVEFRQGYQSMAAPTKEFERLVLKRGIRHGNHPVLRWMASNVAVRLDPAGNMKVDKERSAERVDGIVALIMAIGRAMTHRDADDSPSKYEGGEPIVLGV